MLRGVNALELDVSPASLGRPAVTSAETTAAPSAAKASSAGTVSRGPSTVGELLPRIVGPLAVELPGSREIAPSDRPARRRPEQERGGDRCRGEDSQGNSGRRSTPNAAHGRTVRGGRPNRHQGNERNL